MDKDVSDPVLSVFSGKSTVTNYLSRSFLNSFLPSFFPIFLKSPSPSPFYLLPDHSLEPKFSTEVVKDVSLRTCLVK